MNPPLRLAVLARADAGEWARLLAHPSVRISRPTDIASLAAGVADLAVVVVPPAELAGAAAALAALPQLTPLVLVAGVPGAAHPLAGLIAALVGAKREWEATFDAIQDPVAVLDAEARVVRANRAFADAAGRDVRTLAGLSCAELLGPPERGSGDPIAESLADELPRTQEARYRGFAGVRQVTTAPLGAGRGLVALLKDLTQHKLEQEQALVAARLADVGRLAAGVAHEINTPLASIALRAESLLKGAEDPRLQELDSFKNFPRYLKTIDEETFRCKRSIGALLEFSSSRKRDAQAVDLNVLAERAADLLGHQMKLKQVTLALDLAPDLPQLAADDGQLRQVLIALLMNALDATPGGGHIAIGTRRDGPSVTLSVTDDGAGIPEEVRDRIFTPFFTTKPLGKGTGLGLAICHGIVSAHGGVIRVESEVGRGTRISVALPLVPTR
jgi:signal transduction histidine kinase